MSRLLDYYGEFARSTTTCKHCGWSGKGADMTTDETFGHGADKLCPACGERWGFVQYTVAVADDAPDDWPSKIEPVAD